MKRILVIVLCLISMTTVIIANEMEDSINLYTEQVIKDYQFGIWPSFRKGIISVSGMGLMLGIQTEKEAKAIVNKAIEKGTIALTAKTKVRLLPALNIPNDLLEKGLDTIISAIEEV